MSKRQVLACYKALMKTRQNTFKGDEEALQTLKDKIRVEFENNKDVKSGEVEQLLKSGWEAENFLRTSVVQAKLNERGNYEVHHLPKDLPPDSTLEPVARS
ncbi:Complex III assembly factor LYRM7 [Halotydeus destructor]|nr:Complex III assembly factor LYRM7 [Halotydeus destructor]